MSPWGRLEDRLFWDDKVQCLLSQPYGHHALVLYFAALTYSCGLQTDGRLSPAAQKVCANLARVSLVRCRPTLEVVGLWLKDGDNRIIHNFLKYNPTKAEYEEFRQKENARWHKWKARRNHTDEEEQTPLPTSVGDAVGNADPDPTHTQ